MSRARIFFAGVVIAVIGAVIPSFTVFLIGAAMFVWAGLVNPPR